MTETPAERLERVKHDNVETMKLALAILHANERILAQVMVDDLDAPNAHFAIAGVNMCLKLVAHFTVGLEGGRAEIKPSTLDS